MRKLGLAAQKRGFACNVIDLKFTKISQRDVASGFLNCVSGLLGLSPVKRFTSVTLDLGFFIVFALNLLLRKSSNVTLHPGFLIALALD